MKTLRTFCFRLRNLSHKGQVDRELNNKLSTHLEMHIADNLRAGMTPEQARRQALLKLGGLEQTKESVRYLRGATAVESFFRNLRFGFRLLRKSPAFTAIVVLTLALGIGANTAIFSVVYATVLAPLPYPNPDQLVMVWSRVNGHNNSVSAGDYLDWKRQNSVFQDLIAMSGDRFNLSTSGHPE